MRRSERIHDNIIGKSLLGHMRRGHGRFVGGMLLVLRVDGNTSHFGINQYVTNLMLRPEYKYKYMWVKILILIFSG